MARLQVPKVLSLGPFGAAIPLSNTTLNVTSFIIQGPLTNTDFIVLGNQSGQVHQISPGRELAVNGDNLDNGTTAYMDLSQWYIKALSGNQLANVTYLERY